MVILSRIPKNAVAFFAEIHFVYFLILCYKHKNSFTKYQRTFDNELKKKLSLQKKKCEMKIIVDNKIPYIKGILEPFADVEYYAPADINREVVCDADILIIRTRTRCNRELLEGSKVRYIGTATIGYDHIDTEWCGKNGIVWTNAPGCNASSVGQYILSSLLSLQERKDFVLEGKVIGIVGTYNPDIFNIKFVDYQHLPKVYTIHELFAEGDDDFDIIEYLTEQFEIFNYDDLQNSLLPFVKKLEEIFEEPFTEDTRLGMLIHMGCLIDRLTKKQASAVNFNLDSIRTKYHDEFTMVSEASKKLESTFNVTFSDSDKATIIEIIINNKRRN